MKNATNNYLLNERKQERYQLLEILPEDFRKKKVPVRECGKKEVAFSYAK